MMQLWVVVDQEGIPVYKSVRQGRNKAVKAFMGPEHSRRAWNNKYIAGYRVNKCWIGLIDN
jgi:hypothetical protein